MVAVVDQPSKSIQKEEVMLCTPDLSRMMCDLLHHQSRPEVEIETFRGDPLEYHYFISVFIGVSLLFLDHPVAYKISYPQENKFTGFGVI